MYTEDDCDIENIVNPNWELGLINIVDAINYIHKNLSNDIDNNRLNWKFSGSKKYPSVTICMYNIEMLTPLYSVNNRYGKVPVVRNEYPTKEGLVQAIIECYQDHTREIIQRRR